MKEAVLVRRSAARGDVLLAGVLAQILSRKYNKVYYLTQPVCAEMLECYGHISKIFTDNRQAPLDEKTDFIDLDLAYENRPNMHIVEAYAEQAGFDGYEKYHLKKQSPVIYKQPHGTNKRILIHPAASWANRTFSKEFWSGLIKSLHDKYPDYDVCIVGTKHDSPGMNTHHAYDMRGNYPIGDPAGFLAVSSLLIASDSLMLHVGASTRTPIIGLFTCAEAKYRYPWRPEGIFEAIEAPVGCYGCLHRQPPPVTFVDCPSGKNYACVRSITVDMVMKKVKKILGG